MAWPAHALPTLDLHPKRTNDLNARVFLEVWFHFKPKRLKNICKFEHKQSLLRRIQQGDGNTRY